MSGILQFIKDRARAQRQRIVLPEGGDLRILRAADLITAERLADVILLGKPDEIRSAAKQAGVDLASVTLIDPETDPRAEKYAAIYYERRRAKGASQLEAASIARRPLYFADLMVAAGDAARPSKKTPPHLLRGAARQGRFATRSGIDRAAAFVLRRPHGRRGRRR